MLKRSFLLFFILALGIFSALVWQANFSLADDSELKVHFFDIGQGDAIFIVSPNGNQILVDGGPSNKILSKLSEVMPFWDRSIDLVVLSHPHADHVSGLIDVLDRYDVAMILESGVAYDTGEYKEWRKAAEKEQAQRIISRAGQVFGIGQDFSLEVLAPFEPFDQKSISNAHDANVVLMLRHGDTEVLLMGDAERDLEFDLLRNYNLDSDVLKVGHHGSKTSSFEDFLQRVSPEVVVVQVGRGNRYGHPHPEVMERFNNLKIPVLRTDIDGDLILRSDLRSYSLRRQ